jgi:hypothetical protein
MTHPLNEALNFPLSRDHSQMSNRIPHSRPQSNTCRSALRKPSQMSRLRGKTVITLLSLLTLNQRHAFYHPNRPSRLTLCVSPPLGLSRETRKGLVPPREINFVDRNVEGASCLSEDEHCSTTFHEPHRYLSLTGLYSMFDSNSLRAISAGHGDANLSNVKPCFF